MTVYHMGPEEFRRRGHEMVDWVADYLENVTEYPVIADVEPGSIRAALPDRAPEQPEPFANVVRDLDEIIMPGITHWQSPNWFAYFPANSSGPSLLGEMVAAGLGVGVPRVDWRGAVRAISPGDVGNGSPHSFFCPLRGMPYTADVVIA